MKMRVIVAAAAVAAVLGAGLAGAQVQVDPGPDRLQDGQRHQRQHLERRLGHAQQPDDAVGGDSSRSSIPNAKIQIEGKGSSTAPPALIAGTAQLGPMSRAMKGTEIDGFEKKYGYKPTPIRTSVDALAVFVNKDNPVKCLTLAQVDAAFSKSRRGGHTEDVKTWGQLGLTGEWASEARSASTAGTRPPGPTGSSRSTC